jgi:phosphopantothenoylcysteine decarboxylase
MNILLGVSGSVAAIKLTSLTNLLKDKFENSTIKIVATQNAIKFIPSDLLNTTQHTLLVYTETHEWEWQKIGDKILHIELRNWADVIIIAPLSANTLAKLSHGICDNLLTCIMRAWDRSKPVFVCPAMNVNLANWRLQCGHTPSQHSSWTHCVR